MPEQRKREIYAVCRKYGVLIIEDDPCKSSPACGGRD